MTENWRIGHLDHLESPWGNAGGVVKTVEEAEKMVKTGVGWIEAGSYTLQKRFGNKNDKETGELLYDPETREPLVDYYHDAVSGSTYNSLGMPNPGETVFGGDIQEMVKIAEAHHKKLVVNVAPVSDNPVEESRELVEKAFEAGAHGVLLNGGCPSLIIEGETRKETLSSNAQATLLVLEGLRKSVQKNKKVFFRASPQDTLGDAESLYHAVRRSNAVSAVWTPNTWPGYKPMENGKPALTIEGNIGSKSGPATAKAAYKQVRWATLALSNSGIDVVASGGIANCEAIGARAARQLKKVMDIGAVAGAGTTFFYEQVEDWREDVYRLLKEFSDQP